MHRALLRLLLPVWLIASVAQAAPSETPQQSSTPSGQAIIGAASTCSAVMALRRWAFGACSAFV